MGPRRTGSPLAELFPGYFALIMATGIIAVGAVQQGIRWLAWTLLWVGAAFYNGMLHVLVRDGLTDERFDR